MRGPAKANSSSKAVAVAAAGQQGLRVSGRGRVLAKAHAPLSLLA